MRAHVSPCVWETKPCLMQDNSCWATAVHLKWIKNLFFHYMHFVSARHSPHSCFFLTPSFLLHLTHHCICSYIYAVNQSSNFAATWTCYRLFCMAESAEWFIFEMDTLGRNGLEDSLWIFSVVQWNVFTPGSSEEAEMSVYCGIAII